jgi:hypothetical protein
MLCLDHFRRFVVIPALMEVPEYYSDSAVELLIGTALIESNLMLLKQGLENRYDGRGVALGLYQIEPATHHDIWLNYLASRPNFSTYISASGKRPDSDLITDLKYATKIARTIYRRSPLPLPKADDIEGLAKYWKKVYNTRAGKGDAKRFVELYSSLHRLSSPSGDGK